MKQERKLTPKQQKFVMAYLETGNAAESYRRSYDVSRMQPMTVYRASQELIRHPLISAQLAEMREQASQAAVMDRAAVLNLITEIATADPNQLVQVQVRCCRHCWGRGYRYHWKNDDEYGFACAEVVDKFNRALAAWEKLGKGDRPEPDEPPSDEGGFGFDVFREPNPECPKCLGEGHEVVTARDTRKLTGAAKRLYAGAKRTRDGIEIKMRDQDAALRMLAQAHNVVKELAVGVAMQNNTTVINAEIPNDPVAASRAYQELFKD